MLSRDGCNEGSPRFAGAKSLGLGAKLKGKIRNLIDSFLHLYSRCVCAHTCIHYTYIHTYILLE